MRENTERPATVDIGSNIICGTKPEVITGAALKVIDGGGKKGGVPGPDSRTNCRHYETGSALIGPGFTAGIKIRGLQQGSSECHW